MLDITSADSIIEFAKQLKNQTLRQACGVEIEKHGYKGKGNFGQILEKFYFGYEPNSDVEPDFKEAGIELKSSPLKTLKNGEYRSKERLVLNIINYLEVHKEEFETSSFWKKNAHLLLVFYLHDRDLNLLDYLIKLVEGWQYPTEDLKIIKQDWEFINQKIKDGKAHELSEGDTFYLGACTKGSTALKSFRDQPFNDIKAKQRAYSLKQGYVNHIIANIAQEEPAVYGKIIEQPEILDVVDSIEDIILEKFKPFFGLIPEKIAEKFDLHFNKKAKNYFASITNGVLKAILGVEQDKTIEEFEKADIQVKTIRVEQNNRIEQSVSFPAFDFEQIYNISWRDSELKDLTEKKFLFLFFKNDGTDYVFDKVKFWNMPYRDRNEVRKVWLKTKKVIQTGEIIKEYKTDKNGKVSRINNFPNKSENRVCHVRPHGQTALDTKPLPVMEKDTKEMSFTKQCFWINWDYLRDEIYLK
ncbi:DNA mismatch repair protein MutH [Cellulophaga sp. RHA_52]|uniref:Sau3AI family type II restriction endonuclease n=1 Tax=Cellulophaga sp. RHA_52 TaxID=1250036 RepID=UPI00119B2AB1|nr:Sau3AI family type II restriction endonuclease [Cellulophaga sp. RHA_52]TVZ09799.1 DNA mismatch repair protein MutH [Cellulophaga sp. RHA_52]